jgi:hypothetical protein
MFQTKQFSPATVAFILLRQLSNVSFVQSGSVILVATRLRHTLSITWCAPNTKKLFYTPKAH